jgi:hypothetical protein
MRAIRAHERCTFRLMLEKLPFLATVMAQIVATSRA